MQTIKKLAAKNCILLAVAVTLFSGCGAPGPRALLQGKKLLEQGKYAQAIEKLRTATTLMSTNAQAWNYLGLAYHHNRQGIEADRAYHSALRFDPDLTEARYNLGCLYLEGNNPEAAKVEFTAYTLRRSNEPEGFVKLGTAQLRCRDLTGAERSFSDALRLDKQQVEAWVGIGLARLQRNRPAEAVQYFQSALQEQPKYGPALLNMAIVQQQYLQNRALALRYYREYLALKPTPENAAAVSAIVRQLEQEGNRPLRPGTTNTVSQIDTEVPSARNPPGEAARTAAVSPKLGAGPSSAAPRPPPAETAATEAKLSPPSAVKAGAKSPSPEPPAAGSSPEVVQLAAEPEIKAAQDVTSPATPTVVSSASSTSVAASTPTTSPESKTAKRSFFSRLLGSSDKAASRASMTNSEGGANGAVTEPPPTFNRYAYRAPVRPSTGDHGEAARAFAQGSQAYQAQKLAEAIQAYRRATQLDPAYFEAHYNLGLVASEAGNFTLALAAYEVALAIQPNSSDARYNFALTLKQANYPVDAASELEKILVTFPSDSRTHLALGNLYAQQLRQPAKARPHYLKVLETDQRNAQAGAIRAWLAQNGR